MSMPDLQSYHPDGARPLYPEDFPPIYNPKASALWCLIMPLPFGAILHAINWKALGDDDEYIRQRNWAIGLTIATIIIMFAPVPGIANIILLVIWYRLGATRQIEYVAAHLPPDYQRRQLAWPLLIGLAAAIGICGLAIAAEALISFA